MKKIMVIVNPMSGKGRTRRQSSVVGSMLSKYGMEPTVFSTAGYGDAERLAYEYAGNFDMVLCLGGDGTLNETINGMMKANVRKPLGYIPAGTTNDFAHSVGIPLKFEDAVKLVGTGSPEPHDVGILNGRYFHYTAAFGIFSKCSYSTSARMKKAFGHTAYVMEGMKDMFPIQSYRAKVVCDGKDFSGEYMFGAISNSLSVGGVMKYEKDLVDFSDGVFEMLLVKKVEKKTDILPLLHCVGHSMLDDKYMTFVQGKNFHIEFEEEVPWSLDGEFGGAYKINDIACFRAAMQIYHG